MFFKLVSQHSMETLHTGKCVYWDKWPTGKCAISYTKLSIYFMISDTQVNMLLVTQN